MFLQRRHEIVQLGCYCSVCLGYVLLKDLLQPKLQLSRPIKLVQLRVLAASAGKLAIRSTRPLRGDLRFGESSPLWRQNQLRQGQFLIWIFFYLCLDSPFVPATS